MATVVIEPRGAWWPPAGTRRHNTFFSGALLKRKDHALFLRHPGALPGGHRRGVPPVDRAPAHVARAPFGPLDGALRPKCQVPSVGARDPDGLAQASAAANTARRVVVDQKKHLAGRGRHTPLLRRLVPRGIPVPRGDPVRDVGSSSEATRSARVSFLGISKAPATLSIGPACATSSLMHSAQHTFPTIRPLGNIELPDACRRHDPGRQGRLRLRHAGAHLEAPGGQEDHSSWPPGRLHSHVIFNPDPRVP